MTGPLRRRLHPAQFLVERLFLPESHDFGKFDLSGNKKAKFPITLFLREVRNRLSKAEMSVLPTIQTQGEIRGRMEGNLEVNLLRSVRAMDLADSGRVTLQAPSELVGQLPRTVTLNLDGDARYLLWIVLLFFVGGGIWLGWKGYDDVQQFKDRALLRSNGRDVVAEVTGLSYHRHGPTSVDYEFRFNGATYPGSAEEPNAGPGTSLHKSDKILVRFLPSNPAVNHPYAWEWSPAIGWVWVAFQVFFWAMGGAALVVLCRDRTLARKGHVASGVVTSCVLKDRFFHVEYEFRTADGAPMKGNTDRKEEYETGTRVWVLYLPQRPRRNDLYPLLLFDVAG